MNQSTIAPVAPSATAPAVAQAPQGLSPEQLEQYNRDGFIVLRDRLSAADLAPLQAVFESVVDRQAREWYDAGKITDRCDDLPFETRYTALRRQLPPFHSNSWRRCIVSPAVYSFWQKPGIVEPVRSLIGEPLFASGTWNGRPRAAGQNIQTIDWHQDAHYLPEWAPTDTPTITVWFPLVPVDGQSGCLQVCRGSHLAGYREKVRLERNDLVGLADHEIEPYEIVTCAMNPGDILIFNELTFHRSVDNHSDRVRWSLDIRFTQADSPATQKRSRLGYRCFDPANPASVETYEQWEAKYDWDGEF